MGKFRNESTGVVVSVDDSKDTRFTEGWVSVKPESKRGSTRPKESKPSSK